MRRFFLRRSRWWRPLLVALGGTRERSYADVTREAVRVRFGPGFQVRIPRGDIENAAPYDLPWYAGIGWRANFVGSVGLLGSHRGVVALRFRSVRRVRLFGIPLACRMLFLSLEDPRGFLAALGPRRP